MPRLGWMILLLVLGLGPRDTRAAPRKKTSGHPVTATVETTLTTASDHIRQFAFDGDARTYFASAGNPSSADHFTIRWDRPVTLHSVEVTTGRPDGADALNSGKLEVSTDGKRFHEVARFADGSARSGRREKVQAVRIVPGSDRNHPLVVREVAIAADPPVAPFRYPVEVAVNVDDAPELKDWAENVARTCERAYPMINDELKSEGFRPAHQITLTLKKDYKGVAATSGDRIVGSVAFYKDHPDDVGSMIHETVHVVQRYQGRQNPGWLVEGVADYVRFFKFEPGKLGRLDPERSHYDGSYRVTAAFLNYLTETYDPQLVLKLNQRLRAGTYQESFFKEETGKPLDVLDAEWRATLRR